MFIVLKQRGITRFVDHRRPYTVVKGSYFLFGECWTKDGPQIPLLLYSSSVRRRLDVGIASPTAALLLFYCMYVGGSVPSSTNDMTSPPK